MRCSLWFMLLPGRLLRCSMVSASEMAQPAEAVLVVQLSSKEKPQGPSRWSFILELHPVSQSLARISRSHLPALHSLRDFHRCLLLSLVSMLGLLCSH